MLLETWGLGGVWRFRLSQIGILLDTKKDTNWMFAGAAGRMPKKERAIIILGEHWKILVRILQKVYYVKFS